MKLTISSKRVQIDKSNSTVVLVAAAAAAIVIFSLVASKTLLDQRSFQSRVIEKKKVALTQLQENVQQTTSLVASYRTFVDSQENVIGGSTSGEGPRDGDNAKIVLDALPSKYDFPGLVTSIEKLIKEDPTIQLTSIDGIDEELAQTATGGSVEPVPVPLSFGFEVIGNYESTKLLIQRVQKSIRPLQVKAIELTGGGGTVTLQVEATTYYQPEKIVDIKTETVQ